MTSDKYISQTRPLDEIIASTGKVVKRKAVTFEEVQKVKKLLKTNTNTLWNYLQKKETSKGQK